MMNRFLVTLSVLVMMTLARADTESSAALNAPSVVSGAPFDAVPFGTRILDPERKAFVIRWAEPRKIRRVVVEFPTSVTPPSPKSVRLQYWHQSWDGRPDPILTEAGAGGVGWDVIDDWTNGRWKEADTSLASQGPTWTYTFKPTNGSEFPSLGGNGVAYRKTLKIRLISADPLPESTLLHAYTDATYQPLTVRILMGKPAEPKIQITGQDNGVVEVFNGVLVDLRPLGAAGVNQDPQRHWLIPGDGEGGLEAKLLMAVDPSGSGYDRTVVTIRSRFRPFSFAADEVARGDRILVDDLGVLAAKGGDAVTLARYRDAR